MVDHRQAREAISASWCAETSAVPEDWTPDNPARGQCDVSAFVFWELFGGNLVLAEVYRNGEQTEHHYWNRISGEDIDLTREQFVNGEELKVKTVLANSYVREKIPSMRSELQERIKGLRESVTKKLND